MKYITGKRVPLGEEAFTDVNTAHFYDEHARRFMGSVYRRFGKKVAGIRSAGARVLDIGTGSGLLAIELTKAHPDWQVTGTDISEKMLELAQQNAARAGFNDMINYRQAPAATLPFADGFFSLVVSNASLHLWTDPLKVLQEIARVTAAGGYCLIWDNMRLTALSPLLSLIGRVMGMNAEQRRLWLNAMRASYTVGETKAILCKSAFNNARVSIIPGFFYLSIQWRKSSFET
jgi:ubiquinone/menaquinone biosynthesis C-methylase UbiE